MKTVLVLLMILFFPTLIFSQPQEFKDQLYELLRPKITWLDIDSTGEDPMRLTFRYYPCFSSTAILDMLIRQALAEGIPQCVIQNPGKPAKQEGYCVLNSVRFNCHQAQNS